MRAVLDCNVYVSALIQAEGPCGRILDAAIQGRFECVLSPAILEEIGRVLAYPKIRRRAALTSTEREALLTALSLLSSWVEDTPSGDVIVAEDPSDDIYLHAAMAAGADVVVSGDGHLLKLREHQGIPIVSPRRFLDSLI